MRELTGVHHTAVSVPDLGVARRFYVDLLGATETSSADWGRGTAIINEIVGLPDTAGRQFLARLGNTYIEVFEYSEPVSPPQEPDRPVHLHGYTHVGFQVTDIHAVHARMVEAGIRFHAPPVYFGEAEGEAQRTHGFWATYGRDFFGNVFEILEINEGSAVRAL